MLYDSLNERERKYVDLRGLGHKKKDAYTVAGFGGKNVSQSCHNLELRKPFIDDLVSIIQNAKRAKDLFVEGSETNRDLAIVAQQERTENMLAVLTGDDGETARRIQFYRDIIAGKIKSVKITKKYDGLGNLKERKVEEVSDIGSIISARKELDKILGLNTLVDLGSLTTGDITINIVDAGKREELEDSRNKVFIDPNMVQEIDGEKVLVTEESNLVDRG
jgi:hypothetical protein